MQREHRILRLSIVFLGMAVALFGASDWLWTSAQEQPTSTPPTLVSAAACGTPLSTVWLSASDACVGKPFGYVCNGGITPLVEPGGGVADALTPLGGLVETGVVDAVSTMPMAADGQTGGLLWMRVAAPDTLVQYSGLVVGEVHLRDVTPAEFQAPPWQSFVVQTLDSPERCELAPHSSMMVQSLPGQAARLVVNGVSLDLNGTVVLQTFDDQTHFMMIAGNLRLLALGQRAEIEVGQEVSARYTPDNYAVPVAAFSPVARFSEERVAHLPVLLLDRPVTIPEAGYATTINAANLRTAPSLDAAVLLQAPGGERVIILARNPEGDWYHVRTSSGQTGWMFNELITGDFGEIRNTYVETPLPPQRLGSLGQVARVIAPNGVTLRSAPDIAFAALATLPFGLEVQLMARSPYSPWIKVDSSGSVGWVALITVDTQAIIESLPVDYDVPPPPQPTRIPGSFGNAFPDPSCYPNC